jgi:hypothetical protein
VARFQGARICWSGNFGRRGSIGPGGVVRAKVGEGARFQGAWIAGLVTLDGEARSALAGPCGPKLARARVSKTVRSRWSVKFETVALGL